MKHLIKMRQALTGVLCLCMILVTNQLMAQQTVKRTFVNIGAEDIVLKVGGTEIGRVPFGKPEGETLDVKVGDTIYFTKYAPDEIEVEEK